MNQHDADAVDPFTLRITGQDLEDIQVLAANQ